MSLRLALLCTFPALYVIGALLFLLSYFLMRVDLSVKPNLENHVLSRLGQGGLGNTDSDPEDTQKT